MAEVFEVWSPLIQGGFAVFALLLLGINFWLVKQLLRVLKDNNRVIAGNSRAIESVAMKDDACLAFAQGGRSSPRAKSGRAAT